MKTMAKPFFAVSFLLALACAPLARAQGSAQVFPAGSTVAGQTLGEWSAAWWQWIFSIPASQNPLLDETGAMAHTGQSGSVFFLAGVANVSGTANRTVTIPSDTHLFFPLLNTEYDNDFGTLVPPQTVQQLRDAAAGAMAAATELHLSIDGVPVPNLFGHRETSPAFSFALPLTDGVTEQNLAQYFGVNVTGLVPTAVSDGYYVMLEPLSDGPHTINLGGTLGEPQNFTLNVTYNLSVVPEPLTVWYLVFGLAAWLTALPYRAARSDSHDAGGAG